jgi:hypothetical protein
MLMSERRSEWKIPLVVGAAHSALAAIVFVGASFYSGHSPMDWSASTWLKDALMVLGLGLLMAFGSWRLVRRDVESRSGDRYLP